MTITFIPASVSLVSHWCQNITFSLFVATDSNWHHTKIRHICATNKQQQLLAIASNYFRQLWPLTSLSQNNRVQGFKDSHLAWVIEDTSSSSCIKCKYRDCPLSAHRIPTDCVMVLKWILKQVLINCISGCVTVSKWILIKLHFRAHCINWGSLNLFFWLTCKMSN